MYIKFCRGYGEDKKDEAKENLSSNLSVELKGEKEKQTGGIARLYRAGCILLTTICLVLLVVIIVLSVKLQTGSSVCLERQETTAVDKQSPALAPACSYEQCQAQWGNYHLGCQQCADGWLPFGRTCFYLSTFRLSWDQSQRNCTSRGGSLAVITDQRVQSFLTKEGNLKYWIGLKNKGNKWTWVNNNVLQESYWEENESPGNCGILIGGSQPMKNWVKAPCETYSYFICQLTY